GAPKPYAVAELLALPTHDENFGQVVAEALRAGVPVITTRNAPWDILNERDAGRCVELAGFPEELDRLLGRTHGDLAAAGERGRQWARTALHWPSIGARMAEAYGQVLERWRKSRA